MRTLANRRIIVAVTGSIAAYKSAELVRRLQDAGADVQVVMTEGAKAFITPLTLQALSGKPVRDSLLDTEAEAGMGHIELARWADAVVVAPASANTLARLAQGRADDLLGAICLATTASRYVAPAMNSVMWQDVSTQRNVQALREQRMQILGPASGQQACGEVGEGPMLDVADIISTIEQDFATGLLTGQRVLVTAGPTCEDIDPVRYITNRSSGKMGFAVAAAAVEAGASVTLVAGPVVLQTPDRVTRIDVRSAQDMLQAVQEYQHQADIIIAVAAVSDYRPQQTVKQKIKKQHAKLQLELEKTEDILATLARTAQHAYRVGFAAETDRLEDYARDKLQKKSLHMIAANRVGYDEHGNVLGFDSDENRLTLYTANETIQLPRASKHKLARQLIDNLAKRYHEYRNTIKNTG